MGVSGAGNDKENKLTILELDLQEYILSHRELAQQPDRGLHQNQNHVFFRADFLEGRLARYEGTFVAYQKGILCGQSADGQKLHHQASCYYGGSSLTVFPVPTKKDASAAEINAKLDEAIANAIQ